MTTDSYMRVLDAFRDYGCIVDEKGDRADVQAPDHSPADRSVSVSRSRDRTLIYSHSDPTDQVLDAVGLTVTDLFNDPRGVTYTYPDARQVHRSPAKKFRQSGNTAGTALYLADRLPADLAITVYVVEGEQDADAITAAGGTAVSVAQGAGKAHRADWAPLRGRPVLVVADKDEQGRKHAVEVAEALKLIAAKVTIVEAAVGKDAADHLTAGHGLNDFTQIPDALEADPAPPAEPAFLFTTGFDWLNADDDTIPVLWGDGDEILWAEGEGLLIAAAQGVGKTTLAGCLAAGMLTGTPVLGKPMAQAKRVLYLAMDRPRQARRALRRQLGHLDYDALKDRILIWQGPPPMDLARHPELLREMAREADADVVIVDSLKDAAVKLSDDETGSLWNRAAQTLIADGRNLAVLHHLRKDPGDHPSIDNIYGSTWLTSGMGSVIILTGEAGAPFIKAFHVKQPATEVGPIEITVDGEAGTMIATSSDPVTIAHQKGTVTVSELADALYGTGPNPSQVEKARRKIDRCVKEGFLVPESDGGRTGKAIKYRSAMEVKNVGF